MGAATNGGGGARHDGRQGRTYTRGNKIEGSSRSLRDPQGLTVGITVVKGEGFAEEAEGGLIVR